VDYEYRRDEYHRHWATSIDETFAFHLRCFDRADADRLPEVWDHADACNRFSVWDYQIEADGAEAGIVYLKDVTASGMWLTTRRWAPDGPAQPQRQIRITTAPRYRPNQRYLLSDLSLASQTTARHEIRADMQGRLVWETDGGGYHIQIAGPDLKPGGPVLLPVAAGDRLRIWPAKVQQLPLRVYNPSTESLKNVRVEVSSDYATIEWISREATFAELAPGQIVDLGNQLQLRATAGAGDFAVTGLRVKLACAEHPVSETPLDVLVIPEGLSASLSYHILDGRTLTLPVFRQKGNQGGGGSVSRQITEGIGNGNGRLEPGEAATIWVQLAQGCDPFDKGNWYRTKVYCESAWIEEVEDLQEGKQLEWTGAMERTSMVRLSAETPPGSVIELLLDNESWSFAYTPDVRFGREPLYQAFQRHKHHLHRLELPVNGAVESRDSLRTSDSGN
jgi:hypothetical protein